MMEPMTTTYADAVGSWAAHLRAGGTTTWQSWRDEQLPHGAAEPSRDLHPLPSSTHLELVRRLNLRAGGQAVPGLADVVLATPTPGRGRVDVPLPWSEPVRFGHPPIAPEALPDEELVRLAVGVLARLLPDLPAPRPTPDLVRWPVPWRRRFRLHGAPGTVAAVRAALLAQGLVETDWRPVHLVLARPLEVMMAEHWAAATVTGSSLRWTMLWRRAQATDALPARLDVVGTAERLAAAPGSRDRVHLVVGRDAEEVAHDVAHILGTRLLVPGDSTDAGRIDLLRRLNQLTALAHGPGQVRRLAATLAEVLEDASARAPAVAVPSAVRPWARRSADGLIKRLAGRGRGPAAAGYAVHGDPGALAPTDSDQPGTVDPRHTLELAVEASLLAWRRQERAT